MTIDKPDSLVSMKVKGIKKVLMLIESGKFSDLELQIIFDDFEEDIGIEILRKIHRTNHIKKRQEQKEWQILREESTLLHLRSSWQTEECNINNLTY